MWCEDTWGFALEATSAFYAASPMSVLTGFFRLSDWSRRLTERQLNRRTFLASAASALAWTHHAAAQGAVTRPVVLETTCPIETVTPVAADGHRGLAVLQKPPGPGPFPVAVWFHGGITTEPRDRLETRARDLATSTRLLAAGYVFVAPTYRSRDVDLRNPGTIQDALAVVDHLRTLSYIDPASIVLRGCSGGDLALEAAALRDVCAVVAEEPASVLMTGVFNNDTAKKGERFSADDATFMLEEGRRYYTPELQRAFRAKAATIRSPILIVQGNVDRREGPINRFNADVLIPELRALGKHVEVSRHPLQQHCFCSASGLPRPGGRAAPASWPSEALKAFQAIDAFCHRHVRTAPRALDRSLLRHETVREGPIGVFQ
jgi:acetyl esterase/lipase